MLQAKNCAFKAAVATLRVRKAERLLRVRLLLSVLPNAQFLVPMPSGYFGAGRLAGAAVVVFTQLRARGFRLGLCVVVEQRG